MLFLKNIIFASLCRFIAHDTFLVYNKKIQSGGVSAFGIKVFQRRHFLFYRNIKIEQK